MELISIVTIFMGETFFIARLIWRRWMSETKPRLLRTEGTSPAPFPIHRLKRVEQPTNRITADIQRIDMRDTAYGLAGRGEYGPLVQKGVQKSLPGKYPLSAAQKDLIDHIATLGGNPVARKPSRNPTRSRDINPAYQIGWIFSKGRYRRGM